MSIPLYPSSASDYNTTLHLPPTIMINAPTDGGITFDAWARARDRFVEDLEQDEKRLLEEASLENIFYSASASHTKHHLQSKNLKFVKRMQVFLDAVAKHGKALDVYVNTGPLFLSPIWGSVRILLHVRILIRCHQ